MDRQIKNFVLKGGRLLDPASGLDRQQDIHVRDAIVEAIGADLKADGATVIDVKGLIVTPGLIDVHLHLMNGLGAFGVDPDIFGVGSGVTTVVDAGSAGHSLLTVFRNYVTENAKTRVLNYVNLSTLGGVTGPGYSILADPRLIDEDKIEKAVEANRDIIVGIKIMATGGALGAEGLKPLARARKLGDNLKIPLLVHIGESWTKDTAPVHVGDVLKYLRAGDIVTHMFTAHPGGLLDPQRQALAAGARRQRVRRTHGRGPRTAQPEFRRCAKSSRSRTLSRTASPPTAIEVTARVPFTIYPTTMAKLMALGFSLNQVVEMATVNAAKLLGRTAELGFIRVGSPADISVLRVEEREWKAVDSQKGTIQARQALIPVYAIRKNMIYEPLLIERPYRDFSI